VDRKAFSAPTSLPPVAEHEIAQKSSTSTDLPDHHYHIGNETLQNILAALANGIFGMPSGNRNRHRPYADHGSTRNRPSATAQFLRRHRCRCVPLFRPSVSFAALIGDGSHQPYSTRMAVRSEKARIAGRRSNPERGGGRCELCVRASIRGLQDRPTGTPIIARPRDVIIPRHDGNLRRAETDHRQTGSLARRSLLLAHRPGARHQAPEVAIKFKQCPVRDVPRYSVDRLSQKLSSSSQSIDRGLTLQFNTKVPRPTSNNSTASRLNSVTATSKFAPPPL